MGAKDVSSEGLLKRIGICPLDKCLCSITVVETVLKFLLIAGFLLLLTEAMP